MNATSKEIHEQFGLDWKVTKSELLFEKWMPVTLFELEYHALEPSAKEVAHAKQFCDGVCSKVPSIENSQHINDFCILILLLDSTMHV